MTLVASEAHTQARRVRDSRAARAHDGLFCVGLSHAREDAHDHRRAPRKVFHLLRCT